MVPRGDSSGSGAVLGGSGGRGREYGWSGGGEDRVVVGVEKGQKRDGLGAVDHGAKGMYFGGLGTDHGPRYRRVTALRSAL